MDKVRAYPSLLQPVYSKYINNVQYEYSYMCLGRGWYAVNDVKDGDALSEITGTKAKFYNPLMPNSGSPFLTIGGAIGENINLVKSLIMLMVKHYKLAINLLFVSDNFLFLKHQT